MLPILYNAATMTPRICPGKLLRKRAWTMIYCITDIMKTPPIATWQYIYEGSSINLKAKQNKALAMNTAGNRNLVDT